MKKLEILICLVLIIPSVQSQKISFCEALPILEKGAINQFSDICKEIDPKVAYPKSYFSSLQIEKSVSCKIAEQMGDLSFVADFGRFSSMDEARKKAYELSSDIRKCYSGFKITVSTDKILKTEYHTFSNHSEDGFRLYRARFEFLTLGGETYLKFKFKASTGEDILLDAIPAYSDYTLIKNEIASDGFSMALAKVIVEAKSAFKSIKGESTESKNGFPSYKTTYQVPGFKCFIEEPSSYFPRYRILEFQKGSPGEFPEVFAKAKRKIELALGSKYGFTTSPNGRELIYAHKDQPEKPVLKLYLLETDDEFSLELSVMDLE